MINKTIQIAWISNITFEPYLQRDIQSVFFIMRAALI